MQRQSLGSPLSNLHQAHGGDDTLLLDVDDTLLLDVDKRSNKDISAFSTSSSSSPVDFDDDKAIKPHRLSSPPPVAPDKVIHVIPILTLLCFLILFLFSRTPSPSSDLAQFNGFTRLPAANRIDSITDEIYVGVGGDIRRFIDMRKSDVLAIRSLREPGSETRRLTPRFRSHRKIADF